MNNLPFTLMLVTQDPPDSIENTLHFIHHCCHAGVDAVQLRAKNTEPKPLMAFGKALTALLKPLNIPLIVNDSLALCLALDADGLHLGQSDGCAHEARYALGIKKLIGVSVNTLNHIKHTNQLPIDYIGVGPVFPTKHKTDSDTHWGLVGLSEANTLSKHPSIAIGGVNQNNIKNIVQTGVHGIAAIGAFHHSPHPHKTIQLIKGALCDD